MAYIENSYLLENSYQWERCQLTLKYSNSDEGGYQGEGIDTKIFEF